jgi:hypothetical protein
VQLSYSTYSIQVRENGGQQQVFDIVRNKWVALQPEEWVRQHLLHFLMIDCHFPKGRISVEKKVLLHGMNKRSDIVLYDRDAGPLMLIECKAPEIALSNDTFRQAAMYNLTLQVPYLMITNGREALCASIDIKSGNFQILDGLPPFLIPEN